MEEIGKNFEIKRSQDINDMMQNQGKRLSCIQFDQVFLE
jgi:hypothetical protein